MSEEIKETEVLATAAAETDTLPNEPERVIIFEEAIEAILFAAGHPVSYATLARVFDTTPLKVKEQVMDYAQKYNTPDIPRGVILLTFADACQLCTKKYYLNEIREALGIKRSGTISTSSMEALAIVAYNQPVTRFFVDTLRRADSSYAMNNLLDRGLIEVKGRLDAPGRPMLYGTSHDFLRVFGLKSIDELPKTTEEIDQMFSRASNVDESAEAVQESMDIPATKEASAELTEYVENAGEEKASEIEKSDAVDYDEPSAEDYIMND